VNDEVLTHWGAIASKKIIIIIIIIIITIKGLKCLLIQWRGREREGERERDDNE